MSQGREITGILFFLILTLSLALADCGGGGGGSIENSSYNMSVTLAWDAPSTNEDGTPLNDLAGFKVYYGTSPNYYTESIDVSYVSAAVIDNLSSGPWCFAVTAYDTSGNESNYSNEVCTNIE